MLSPAWVAKLVAPLSAAIENLSLGAMLVLRSINFFLFSHEGTEIPELFELYSSQRKNEEYAP